MRRLVFALAAAAGCDGVQTNPIAADAAPVDIDAAPDAMDIDAPVVLAAHHYVIDSQVIPQTSAQARSVALDINNDLAVDNQLGQVMAAFAGFGYDVQTPATQGVDRGAALSLVAFESDGFANSPGTFTLFTGAAPNPAACANGGDTVCRHHLDGSGMFEVAATSARDTPLAGTLSTGAFLSFFNPNGRLQIQTHLLTGAVVTLNLIGARAKLTTPSTTGIMSGSIAGAVAPSEVDTKLVPAWQQRFDAAVVANCPGSPPDCGCTPGSLGKVTADLFDTNPKDCRISLAEVTGNSLIQSLLAPDVVFDGQPAISLAIGFSAVKATFTP